MDGFNSDAAGILLGHFNATSQHIDALPIPFSLLNISPQEQAVIDILREASEQIEEGLSNAEIRVRNHALLQAPVLPSTNVHNVFERYTNCVFVVCTLADLVEAAPPANPIEAEAILGARDIIKRVNTFLSHLFDLIGMPRNRFRNAKNAYVVYFQQRQFYNLIKQNWHRFTFPVLHEVQNSILNASEQIESILRHNKIRVQEHLRLGKPVLPDEPTFQQLFKRLKNTIHVLCVLIEADDLKQGPALNEDEINVIKEGKKILDELKNNINKFINEAEGEESSDGGEFFKKSIFANMEPSSGVCEGAETSKNGI